MTDPDFERAKAAFEQNCEQARSLNQQLNQLPAFAVTLTGGLWFASNAAGVDPRVRFALLVLAGIADLALLVVALRIRDVLEGYFEAIRAFHASAFPGSPRRRSLPWLGSYGMVATYAVVLGMAAAMSLYGAFVLFRPERWL